MRKITKQMLTAYNNGQSFKSSNTKVIVNGNSSCGTLTQIYLFENLIAEDSDEGLKITNCGWKTDTTKERLNALPNVSIHQNKGKWYLNGNEWNGEWTKVI